MASKGDALKFQLPEDMTAEVLSRLPIKSLLRFKCVCREWHSLISSPSFASLHLKHSISDPLNQSILVHIKKPRKSISFDPVTFSPRNNHLNICLDQGYYFGDEIQFVGSINGLVCTRDLPDCRWVCLWNPTTRMFRPIATRMPYNKAIISHSIGFGFDPIANDYKVVVFYSRDKVGNVGLTAWSAKLESWRDIKVDAKIFISRGVCDVIVNEFAYWIFGDKVAIFNMSTEVLRLIPIPPVHPDYNDYHGFIWKGNFALATCYGCPGKYQAWTLIENDSHGKEFWRKTFTIGLEKFGAPIFCFCKPINFQNGKLLYTESTMDLILYDIETKKMKTILSTKFHHKIIGSHYHVESLISLKGFKPFLENAENAKKMEELRMVTFW